MTGFLTNVAASYLLDRGYTLAYDQAYSWSSQTSELIAVRGQCKPSSSICVAGTDLLNNIVVSACGNCLNILLTTTVDVPHLVSGVWWYFTPSSSFGFAPTWEITQSPADTTTVGAANRLSWIMTGGAGGYRVGTLTNVSNANYRKQIYLLV